MTQMPHDEARISNCMRQMFFAALLLPGAGMAGPFAPPGDIGLRHDVQILADAGVIDVPVTTWPLSWGDIANSFAGTNKDAELTSAESAALLRLKARIEAETLSNEWAGQLKLSGDTQPRRVRRFASSPRAEGEAGAAIERTGLRFAVRLEVTAAADPRDGKRARLDGSFAGLILGNWSVTAGEQDQWWGPGYEGSLILSNNARPVPGVLFKRNRSLRFKSKWLSWIGPWTASFFAGQLEGGRAVPEANLLGARVAFKPGRSLEIGLSRTAQWCGKGRPCGAKSFWNMLIGNDNSGEQDNLGRDEEPGNQLAGFDLRFATHLAGRPLALYGQFIGEDEAGGLPSRYLGQLGVETWGAWGEGRASYRLNLEYSDTACDFPQSSPGFDCAYNNSLYPSGYRYRGRSLGHPMDNDGQMISLSGLLVSSNDQEWGLTLRYADLNRGGAPDAGNSVAAIATRYLDVELRHSRELTLGFLDAGAGFETFEREQDGASETDARVFVQWRSR